MGCLPSRRPGSQVSCLSSVDRKRAGWFLKGSVLYGYRYLLVYLLSTIRRKKIVDWFSWCRGRSWRFEVGLVIAPETSGLCRVLVETVRNVNVTNVNLIRFHGDRGESSSAIFLLLVEVRSKDWKRSLFLARKTCWAVCELWGMQCHHPRFVINCWANKSYFNSSLVSLVYPLPATWEGSWGNDHSGCRGTNFN